MSYAPQPSYYHLYPSFYHEHCIYSHRDVETTTTPTIAQSEPPDDEANSSTADSASLPFSSSTSPAVELSETGSITDLPPFDLSLAESVLQITVDDGVPTPSYDEVLAYAVLRSERAVQSSESLHFTFYWSRKEQMAFAPLVHLFGTDWDQIADVIGTKCTIMVRRRGAAKPRA